MKILDFRTLGLLAAVCLAPAIANAQAGWFFQDVATIPSCVGAGGVQTAPTVSLTGLGRDAQGAVVGWQDNCSKDANNVSHPFWFARNSCSAETWTSGFVPKPVESNYDLRGAPAALITASNGTAKYFYAAQSGSGPYSDGTGEAFPNHVTFSYDLATATNTAVDLVGYSEFTNSYYPVYAAASSGKTTHWTQGVGYGGGQSPYMGSLVRDGATLRYLNADGTFTYLDNVSLRHLAYAIGDDGSHHIVYVTYNNQVFYTTQSAAEVAVRTGLVDDHNAQVWAITTSTPRLVVNATVSGGISLALGVGNRLHLALGGFVAAHGSATPVLIYATSTNGFATSTLRQIDTNAGAAYPSIAMNRADANEHACVSYWHDARGLHYACSTGAGGGFDGSEVLTPIGDAPASVRAIGTRLWFDGRDDAQPTIAFFDASTNTIRTATEDVNVPVTAATPALTGWSRIPVTVTMAANDCPGSGVEEIVHSLTPEAREDCTWCMADPIHTAGTTATRLVSTEGINVLRFFAVDRADRREEERTIEVKIDQGAPTIRGERRAIGSPSTLVGLWSNRDVELSFVCEDFPTGRGQTASGVRDCTSARSFTTEGLFSVTGTAHDLAGNTATRAMQVGIDKTAPLAPTVTLEGWSSSNTRTFATTWNWFGLNTMRVLVKATCQDRPSAVAGAQVSGIEYCPSEQLFVNSLSRSFDVTVRDRAGNQASRPVAFGVDWAMPNATVTLVSTPVNGWYRNPLVITVECEDRWEADASGSFQSGIDPNSDCGKTIQRDATQSGTNVYVLASNGARDKAGNVASPPRYLMLPKADVTPPALSCTLSPAGSTVHSAGTNSFPSSLVSVTATVDSGDAHSGLEGTFRLKQVRILHDADTNTCRVDVVPTPGTTSIDVEGAALGTADTQFQFRSERCRTSGYVNGELTGDRTYEVTYEATDKAGNVGTASCEFKVTTSP